MIKLSFVPIFAFLGLVLCTHVFGQNLPGNAFDEAGLWEDIAETSIELKGERQIIPLIYRTVHLDLPKLKGLLLQAPLEGASAPGVVITLPFPDGSFEFFEVVEAPVMAPELASQFPEIKTYLGSVFGESAQTVRLDVTPAGFHAMVLGPGGTIYIDPYSKEDTWHYNTYYKKDFRKLRGGAFGGGLMNELNPIDPSLDKNRKQLEPQRQSANRRAGDCQLRTYRLALSCTGEYATFHGGTTAQVMAAMTTSMNRVNGVYERESAIRMIMVANNASLIYLNAATDPFTNGNGGTMLGENQTTCDNVIGSANYDIGHVFSTGGGGVAYLRAPCNNNIKAGGVTGLGSPVGDPFDIDYVAHEMGHQFGGNHTQNNNCNRSGASYEPGSASTIMGYAGICAPNVQNNSDDYFHAINIQEIAANITTGTSSTCPVTTPLANTAPTASAGMDHTVPVSTPFELTATATDPDANILTYCWEQFDNQPATMPPSPTSTVGPSFRTFSPTIDPVRTFPRLADLVNNVTPVWEVIPSVSRVMNFRLTVRDNAMGAGCTAEDDMVVTFDNSAGPFLVTSPNTNVTWTAFTTEVVTWSVANTDQAPVSCANVNILLSTDGGYTYPITLAANTPNDGNQAITVPNNPSTTARVKVVCADNIFFDISDTDFTIVAPVTPDFSLFASPGSQTVCGTGNPTFNVDVNQILSFSSPVTLSVTGVPAGVVASFSNNPVAPGATSTLTLTQTGAVIPGTYTLTVSGTSTTGTKTLTVSVSFSDLPIAAVNTFPPNGATAIGQSPTFTWASSTIGATYEIEISQRPAFMPLTESASGLATASYTPTTPLAGSTVYYWRVRTSNSCGVGPWSVVTAFQTALLTTTCTVFSLSALNARIPSGGSSGNMTSILTVATANAGLITDLNVTQLEGTHTWMGDLEFILTSPMNTAVQLINRECGSDEDFDVRFDDAAASAVLPCPPTDGNAYQPSQVLSAFNGENPDGNWELEIVDHANQDIGRLQDWALEVCQNIPTPPTNVPPSIFVNNPLTVATSATGTIINSLLQTNDPDNTPVQLFYTLMTIPANGTLYLNGTPLGIGSIFTQADINSNLLTYTHNGNTATTDNFMFNVGDGSGGWFGSPIFNIIITSNPQPVVLLGPFAEAKEKSIEVTWQTLQEVNNAGFDVEWRLANSGNAFKASGFVAGAGESQEPLDYSFHIENVSPGTYEIRLNQIDLDGTEAPSRTVEVTINASEGIYVYPSPVQETLFFLIHSSIDQPARIEMYDAKGKLCMSRWVEMEVGENRVSVDVTGLSQGMYFYQVKGATVSGSGKVVRR